MTLTGIRGKEENNAPPERTSEEGIILGITGNPSAWCIFTLGARRFHNYLPAQHTTSINRLFANGTFRADEDECPPGKTNNSSRGAAPWDLSTAGIWDGDGGGRISEREEGIIPGNRYGNS